MSHYNPTKQDYAERRAERQRQRAAAAPAPPAHVPARVLAPPRLPRALRRSARLLARPLARLLAALWKLTLGRFLFLKITSSHSAALTEVASTRFVAAHTSIPVPRPLLCFRWRAASYILMTRVPGHDLEQVWERLDAPARDAILAQLAPYTAQLRAIPSPHGPAVCSVLAGPVHDMRLPSAHRGPFPDEPAMNHVLRGFHDPRDLPPAVAAAHARPHPIVFTHGDLAPRNVMVHGTTVTGIIDWGAAGWFPAHWEYRKARWAVFDALADAWIPYLPRFIPPFPLEADADDYLDRRFWYPS